MLSTMLSNASSSRMLTVGLICGALAFVLLCTSLDSRTSLGSLRDASRNENDDARGIDALRAELRASASPSHHSSNAYVSHAPFPTGSSIGAHDNAASADITPGPPSGSTVGPRLAAVLLLDPNGNLDGGASLTASVLSFVDSYTGSPYDLLLLYCILTAETAALEATLNERLRAGQAGGLVRLRFVDVHLHFMGTLDRKSRPAHGPSCAYDLGYRLMCRFMAGPVYWLPELDAYEQMVRLDDDSRFTRPISTTLELQGSEMYAYALVNHDHEDCQTGWAELVRAAYEGSSEVLRFGPLVYAAPWVHNDGNLVYNCNFEVAALARFRTARYRAFWSRIDAADLFLTTRLGDHQVKTVFLETFEPAESAVCYHGLPYTHHGGFEGRVPKGDGGGPLAWQGLEGLCGGPVGPNALGARRDFI